MSSVQEQKHRLLKASYVVNHTVVAAAGLFVSRELSNFFSRNCLPLPWRGNRSCTALLETTNLPSLWPNVFFPSTTEMMRSRLRKLSCISKPYVNLLRHIDQSWAIYTFAISIELVSQSCQPGKSEQLGDSLPKTNLISHSYSHECKAKRLYIYFQIS